MSRGDSFRFYCEERKRLSVSDHDFTCDCHLCRTASRYAEQQMQNAEPQKPNKGFCDSFGPLDSDDY